MQKAIFLILITSKVIFSQTTVNPDISVLGDLIVESDADTVLMRNSGIELALQGYVNPFARADVFVHKHDGESALELEEAFLTLERGLPFGLGFRTGKFRPSLGKINREHFHTYYYILPSLPVQNALGEEMWSATGVEVLLLAPLPWYSQVTVGYAQQGILETHYEENGRDHDHEAEGEETSPAALVRFSNFFDLTLVTHLEAGLSFYRETSAEMRQIIAGDFKLRWRPDAYRSFTWQGDIFLDDSDEVSGYTWANYQFDRVWNVGCILDYSSSLDAEEYVSLGLFLGFSPVEESSVFRVRLHREYHGEEVPSFSVVAQVIWSLGPHKPHRF